MRCKLPSCRQRFDKLCVRLQFYKDGDTNIPALNEVKMTKEERQKAKEEEKQRKKKAKEARRVRTCLHGPGRAALC